MKQQLDIFMDGFVKVTKYMIIATVIFFMVKAIAATIYVFMVDVVFQNPLISLLFLLLGIIFIVVCYVVGYENKSRE